MDVGVFMEPKGFIKIFEFVFSICAFATLVSYSSWMTFNVQCYDVTISDNALFLDDSTLNYDDVGLDDENKTFTDRMYLEYPFKLEEIGDRMTNCDGESTPVQFEDKSSSHAIFFVFVAVVSFLFTLVMIPVYLFQKSLCANIPAFPSVDLIVHGVFVLFWFCAAVTWSAGLANLKVSTDRDNVLELNDKAFGCSTSNVCDFDPPSNYAGPVVSVIFGFVNLMLFVGNLWFVYKDTAFHS